MLPAGLWARAGADVPQLRAILRVRLLMDDRRPLVMGRKQKKPSSAMLALTAFFSFLTGAFLLIPLTVFDDAFTGVFAYYTGFLTFTAFALVTDFSNILVDGRHKHILLPRPVSGRTLALARMLHVFVYLFRNVFPMALPGWIVAGILLGWKAAIIFPVALMLLTFLALFLVNGIYLLLLTLTSAERFKAVINWVQIGVSVLFFSSYYLLPRAIDDPAVKAWTVASAPWMRALPSYWFTSLYTLAGLKAPLAGAGYFAALAVVGTLVLAWFTLRVLAPQFSKKLGALDGVAAEAPTPVRVQSAPRGGLRTRLARVFTHGAAARAGFGLAWMQTARSRAFKMRVYPSLAYIPVYFVWLLTSSSEGRGLAGLWDKLRAGNAYLLLLYLSSFALLQAVSYIAVSEQFKAGWIFAASPLRHPGRLMSGAFTALWVKFFLPYFAVIGGFVVAVWGPRTLPDLALALCNATLFVMVVARIAYRRLPFSMPENAQASGGRILRVIFSLLIPALMGLGHYAALRLWWMKAVLLLVSAAALWWVWTSYRDSGWADIQAGDVE